MNALRLLLAGALATTFGATAQQHIEAALGQASTNPDANVTYVERRDDNHRLYRVTTVLQMSDPEVYRRLVEAFEADKGMTYYATRTSNLLCYRFRNNEGSSSYTLSNDSSGNTFSLVKQWRAASEDDDDD